MVSEQNWWGKIRWIKRSGYRKLTVKRYTATSYKSDVCLFSHVLFRMAGRLLGPEGRVMKYLQRKNKVLPVQGGRLAQAVSWMSDQFGQVKLANWQEHKTEGKAEQNAIHLHHGAARPLKQKQALSSWKNKRRAWFCISEGALCNWHPCVAGSWELTAERRAFVVHQEALMHFQNMAVPFLVVIAT